MAVRAPSIRLNGEVSIFVDLKKKKHSFSIDLVLDPKNGEVKGALVVENETDKEWQLVGVKQLTLVKETKASRR